MENIFCELKNIHDNFFLTVSRGLVVVRWKIRSYDKVLSRHRGLSGFSQCVALFKVFGCEFRCKDEYQSLRSYKVP